MSLQDVFIANLKKFRKERGLSQMKLAERCDTSTSYIGEIEIGVKFPSVTMIEKLAGALHIPAHLLFIEDQAASFAASFEPLIPDEVKAELIQQINTLVNKIIKKY
jgi:transcriptional regulator with XRE-family HTH domain